MAYFYTRLSLGILLSSVIVSCASYQASESEQSIYYESSFNDHNSAPKAFSPTTKMIDGTQLNPMYLRSQADYHFAMGEAYSLEGNHQKAIESFKATLNYDPN